MAASHPAINYLRESPLTQVLADGLAELYHQKPKFPVTYLADYLLHHSDTIKLRGLEGTKKQDVDKAAKDVAELKKREEAQHTKKKLTIQQRQTTWKQFIKSITETDYHEGKLSDICNQTEKEFKLTGVYVGELQPSTKEINIQVQDGEEAHLLPDQPKVIRYVASSKSHAALMTSKTVSVETIVGRLLTGKATGGSQQGGEAQDGGAEPTIPQEIYIPSVIDNKVIKFMKYPRLGSFFAVRLSLVNYLNEKHYDANKAKVLANKKAVEDFQKELEEKENKFKEQYEEKINSGADEKTLQEFQKQFEEQKPKMPQMEPLSYQQREFAFCFDTMGQDREITQETRNRIQQLMKSLKNSWEEKEKESLMEDFERQYKLASHLQGTQAQLFTKIIEEQEREVMSLEEVEKVKDNQKLHELEIASGRLDKVKDYVAEDKYETYLDTLLAMNMPKFQEIIKVFLLFKGFSKEEVTIKGTNILDWRNARSLLTKQKVIEAMTSYRARGSNPNNSVRDYTKWGRIGTLLAKYDQSTVASFNIFLAFILRFLQLVSKVRIADRAARLLKMVTERQNRVNRAAEIATKEQEKQEKLAQARKETQQKEEVFDEAAWLAQHAEQNPIIELGPEIADEIDLDIEDDSVPVPSIEPAQ